MRNRRRRISDAESPTQNLRRKTSDANSPGRKSKPGITWPCRHCRPQRCAPAGMIPSPTATATFARLWPARCGDVFGMAAPEIATRLAVFIESPRMAPRLTESHRSGRFVFARRSESVARRCFPEHCAAPRGTCTPVRFSSQAGPIEPDGLGGRSRCDQFGFPPGPVPAIRPPATRHSAGPSP